MLEIRSERKSQAGTERLQTDAINARLNSLRKKAVTMAAKSCLRHGATGGYLMTVKLTTEPGDVG